VATVVRRKRWRTVRLGRSAQAESEQGRELCEMRREIKGVLG